MYLRYFARPRAEESEQFLLKSASLPRIKEGEQMPVFSQAPVLGVSESEVFLGTQTTGVPRAQPSGLSSMERQGF
jgi:hypothetical protein